MTIDNAAGTPFEGLMEAGAREDDVLCLLLLYHRHVLKERSPLKRHMEALPQEYHQTIFYSGERRRAFARGVVPSRHRVPSRESWCLVPFAFVFLKRSSAHAAVVDQDRRVHTVHDTFFRPGSWGENDGPTRCRMVHGTASAFKVPS